MANQFYVQPANIMPGMQAAMGGIMAGAEAKQQLQRGQQLEAKREELSDLYKTGTPDEVGEFFIKNPDLAKEFDVAKTAADKMTREEEVSKAWDIYTGKVDPAAGALEHAEEILKRGGNAAESLRLAEMSQQDPEIAKRAAAGVLARYDTEGYKAYRESQGMGEKKTTPATDIDDYVADAEAQYLLDNPLEKSMPPGERNRARREFKRVQAKEAAGVKTAVTTAELQARAKLEPAVRTAVDQAAAEVKAQVDAAEGKRSNDLAWNVYDTGMRNLTSALSGTTTGPGMDWIPAITANAQMANGAVAAMAPVLKQMFRASGEGVFTDKDQQMLIEMLPTRNDHPAARDAKLAGINSIVKAKLNMSEAQQQPQQAADPTAQPTAQYTEGQTATGPGGQKFVFRNGNWGPM